MAHANLAEVYLINGRIEEARLQAEEALAIRPRNANAHNSLGLAMFQKGEVNAAVAHWREALQADPNNMNSQSNLAWVFATCPEPAVRNGAKAVDLMQRVIARRGFTNAIVLRTLAAAYAEDGKFDEAIRTARQAIELAARQRNTSLISDLQANIARYQQNMPSRDPSLAAVRP